MSEKLQKVLADHGLGSRREMERWIRAGRIGVNGRVAHIGDRVGAEDEIAADGRKLARRRAEPTRVLVVNKRAGVIVSRHDPEGRASLFDELPKLRSGRWIAAGRLDLQTTGLILLTNDGALANRLTHPSTGIDREYAVRVAGKLDASALERLKAGVDEHGQPVYDAPDAPDAPTRPRRPGRAAPVVGRFSDIRYYNGTGVNHWYHVVLMEGRKHEVRELFASAGVTVTRLKRVRYGPVILPPWLPRGAQQEMGAADLTRLCAILGLPARAQKTRSGANSRTMLIAYPRLGQAKPGASAGAVAKPRPRR